MEQTCQQLEGAFALVFKSVFYPGQTVATRRGSPLLVSVIVLYCQQRLYCVPQVGIKTKHRLATDHVPIFYSKDDRGRDGALTLIRSVTMQCGYQIKAMQYHICTFCSGETGPELSSHLLVKIMLLSISLLVMRVLLSSTPTESFIWR